MHRCGSGDPANSAAPIYARCHQPAWRFGYRVSVSLPRSRSRLLPLPLLVALAACGGANGSEASDGETEDGIFTIDRTTTGSPTTGPQTCETSSEEGTCPPGVPCILGECAASSQACAHEFDGFCDEGALCEPGTDPFDCCATPRDGVCEEKDAGGTCPLGSDAWDCGKCLTAHNGYCDEGLSCPSGSDADDCCAVAINNGVCEPNCGDDDWLDCGGPCPFDVQGQCDELQCPLGTDPDCCAMIFNGICEEEGQGGSCPAGADPWDCGVCPYTEDNACDEPALCPPGSDSADCCPSQKDGTCDEYGAGGTCPAGTDFYDCGDCPWKSNGQCDEPDRCPAGSDGDECP
jgi:hypothetical protein